MEILFYKESHGNDKRWWAQVSHGRAEGEQMHNHQIRAAADSHAEMYLTSSCIPVPSEFDLAPFMGFSTALLNCVICCIAVVKTQNSELMQSWMSNSSMSCSRYLFSLHSNFYMKNWAFWYASLLIHIIPVKNKISFQGLTPSSKPHKIKSHSKSYYMKPLY